MLDQQYFKNETYHDYLNQHFTVFFSDVNGSGQELFERYKAYTEILTFVDYEGNEVDRFAAHHEPEVFQKRLEDAFRGDNSFKKLNARLAENPNDTEVNAKLLLKYTSIFNWDEAVKFAKTVLAKPEEAKKIPLVYAMEFDVNLSGYELAKALMVVEDPKAAVDYVVEFPRSRIKERVYRLLRDHFRNKHADVEDVAKALLAKAPGNETLNREYIRYLAREERIDEALSYADKVYADGYFDEDGGMIAQYIDLLIRGGKKEKVPTVVSKFVKENPDDYYFYSSAYINLSNGQMYDEAFELLEKGIAQFPDRIYLSYAYGRTSAVSGLEPVNGEKHLRSFLEKALTAEGDNEAFKAANWQAAARWRIGLIYESLGQMEKALAIYEEGLKHDPEYSNLKNAYEKLKGDG